MEYHVTTATRKLLKLTKRIRGVAGGTSASKTISIILWLIDYAQSNRGKLISIVSESFPHLKRGVMRDFQNIMEDRNYWKPERWNKTDKIYEFETGSKIEFFSADQPSKTRGPRRDVLFVNECNNIPYEAFDQMEVRTKEIVWLDWNPVAEFWWYTEVVPFIDVDFITLTYLDNEHLDENIVRSIEAHKHNKNWWKVYGLGQLGEAEGRIYTGWSIIPEVPEEARLVRYGLDFGYTNDETGIVAVYKWNGGILLDEICYKKAMSNRHISEEIKKHPDELVIADSAEPKSIDELLIYGVDVIPSTKGQGSVLQGIQSVQDRKIFVTKRSINLIKEYRNYLWQTDKEGRIINKPTDYRDHLLDAVRYAITDIYPIEDVKKEKPKQRTPGSYVGWKNNQNEDDSNIYEQEDFSKW